jgi:hypothetical protein
MKQPTVPVTYQEERTILPEPNIQISQGIDWESIGRSAANLGIEVVSKMREDENETKILGLQTLQKDVANGIKTASEINDFDRVDKIRQSYRDQVKGFVNGDIDDPTYIGNSMAERKLLAVARGFDADIELGIQESKQGWSDTLAFENYQQFRLSEEERLVQDPAYIEEALNNVNSMYERIAGVGIDKPLDAVGYSASTRKLLNEIQKDRVDLLKTKEKLGKEPMNVKTMAENARTQFMWAANRFSVSKELTKEANDLEEKPNLSESERQKITELRAKALREAITGGNIYKGAMQSLVEQAKTDIVSGYPEDFVGPPDIPQELLNPDSPEALETLFRFGIDPVDANAMLAAYSGQEELLGKNTEFKVARAMMSNAVSTLKQEADSIVSVAKMNVDLIDGQLSALPENDLRRIDLLIQRDAIIASTHKKLYERTLEPVLPPSFKSTKRLLDFIDKGWMAYAGIGDVPVRFDDDQIQLVSFLTNNGYGSAREVYSYAQQKYNQMLGANARIPTGLSGGRDGTGSRRTIEDNRDKVRFWANGIPDTPPTQADVRRWSIEGMLAYVGAMDDGSLPPLPEALYRIENGLTTTMPIPSNRDIFMHTRYFADLVELVRYSVNEEEVQSWIDRVNKAFNADKIGEDIYPVDEKVTDSLESLIKVGAYPNITEQLFLFVPDVSRSRILDKLKKDESVDQLMVARLEMIDQEYKQKGKTSSPKLLLQSIAKDARFNGTVVARAKTVVAGIKAVPAEPKQKETEEESINRKNKETIEETVIPAILERMPKDFGIALEQLQGDKQLRKSFYDRFLPTIVSHLSPYIDPETNTIKIPDNMDSVTADIVKGFVDQKWRFDGRYGMWTQSPAPSQFLEQTISKQRFEARAGNDVGEANRLNALLISEPQKVQLDDTSARILVGTFSDYPNANAAMIKKNYEEDPYATLALLAMKTSSVGNITDAQLFSALRQITSDESIPKDNLTIMALATASRMIPVDTLPQDYPQKLRTMAAQVRDDITSKTGRFKVATTQKPSRNPDERGSLTETVVVFDGDRPIFELQPQQYSYNNSLDIIEKMTQEQLEKTLKDISVDKKFKDRVGLLALKKSGKDYIFGSSEGKVFTTAFGTRAGTNQIYYSEKDKKTGKINCYVDSVYTSGFYIRNTAAGARIGSHGFYIVDGTERRFIGSLEQ